MSIATIAMNAPESLSRWLHRVMKIRGKHHILSWNTVMECYTDDRWPLLAKAIDIADLLFSLGLDNETLSTVLLYPAYQTNCHIRQKMVSLLSEKGHQLLHDLSHIQHLEQWHQALQQNDQQIENVRKMLLAMVSDGRAILIILAERLWYLQKLHKAPMVQQKHLAQESLKIYASLANRLGIWQLKQKIENLCLFYLDPIVYHTIENKLRIYCKAYDLGIKKMVHDLTEHLKKAYLRPFQISSRMKHIYGIHQKMLCKNKPFETIHDIVAMRILTNSIRNCYLILNIVHHIWPPLSNELNDYIMHPKANGYRSIHTVIVGPNQYAVEIQIRTYQMHQESELGVAAHWRYKEGILQASCYEAKIALLRQVLAWQQDIVTHQNHLEETKPLLFCSDRVDVFTPQQDRINLPQGATPVDFAYYIHSEVGHGCRGAKVNGQVVPLTYILKTGDCVEILIAKPAVPSEDWLNKDLRYLQTKRACIRVRRWFKINDRVLR